MYLQGGGLYKDRQRAGIRGMSLHGTRVSILFSFALLRDPVAKITWINKKDQEVVPMASSRYYLAGGEVLDTRAGKPAVEPSCPWPTLNEAISGSPERIKG